ncbi:MAG TPA: MBL fold metallo-hydrolase [Verrucomicrobiae bacterium]|jgi:Cft2 family RNA processing exonuclease|nr:MBL fold metallo-hydrolase [Verrucomicrobiae bacterium]
MRITNLNPDTAIGASSWLVQMDKNSLLMDAGMHPKREGRAALPLFESIGDIDLDAIALSHCHHDHVGSLPLAMRRFQKAHVLMTELSFFLTGRILHNSVNVMTRQRDEFGINEYPLYTHDEVDMHAPRFRPFKYNREIEWAGFDKTRAGQYSPTVEFFDAGHALGSAGMLVKGKSESLFFTGDVCFHDQTLLQCARFQNVKADVLLMETTRGNRATPPGFTRAAEVERLAQAILNVFERNGSVLMPTFALGRTQEILAQLAFLMREGRIPRRQIYIGGLGRVFTEIYDFKAHLTNRFHPDLQLLEELQLVVLEKDQLSRMKLGGGKLFVVTSGMMAEFTPAHEIALRMAEDERQAIFFVGYSDPDTPAGRLRAAKAGEPFVFSASGGSITRRCEMQEFDLTAHANREELLNFVGAVAPRAVLLGHGEDASRQWFQEQILLRHPHIKVFQPKPGEPVDV